MSWSPQQTFWIAGGLGVAVGVLAKIAFDEWRRERKREEVISNVP